MSLLDTIFISSLCLGSTSLFENIMTTKKGAQELLKDIAETLDISVSDLRKASNGCDSVMLLLTMCLKPELADAAALLPENEDKSLTCVRAMRKELLMDMLDKTIMNLLKSTTKSATPANKNNTAKANDSKPSAKTTKSVVNNGVMALPYIQVFLPSDESKSSNSGIHPSLPIYIGSNSTPSLPAKATKAPKQSPQNAAPPKANVMDTIDRLFPPDRFENPHFFNPSQDPRQNNCLQKKVTASAKATKATKTTKVTTVTKVTKVTKATKATKHAKA